MIRVNFLIDRLSRAGTESQLLALIRSVDRSRVVPSLTLLDGTDPESSELAPSDCPVCRLGLKSFGRPEVLSKSYQLVRFWRDQRVDVVQTYFTDSTYLGVSLARLAGVKRVVRVRNNLGHWLTPRHRILGRFVGRMADVSLTNSEKGREALITAERLPAARVAVLENGVDLERFDGLRPADTSGASSARVCVGVVGNLRSVKNIDGFIRAATMLKERFPHVEFAVAGEGDERPRLEAMIRDGGLTDRFRLMGQISDVPAFLSSVDVAVLCSHAESMSNAVLEYMAAVRPVVATRVGANATLIGHNERGLLIEPGDDVALAEAIGHLLDHPRRAAQLAREAREYVEDRYGRAAMCRRFVEFYERLVA